MGIKNWTVTVETVKSVAAREVYFENKDEPSHADSLSLTKIWNGESASMRMMTLCEQAKAKQKAARKGGRPPTAAVEFVFVLPSDLEQNGSDDDWKELTKDMIRSLARSLDVDPNDLSKVCRGSLHREPQTSSEDATKGTHLHLMVGKILPNGTPMPKLQQKKALHEVKQAFNASVLKHLGHSHEMYVARTNSNKKRFKNSWFKKNADLSRAVQAVQRNCNNLTKYVLELNAMRIMSTKRRLNKALEELEELKTKHPVEEQQMTMMELLVMQSQQVQEQADQALAINRETYKVEQEIEKKKPKRDKNGTIVGWVEDK
ncbi:TPA: hypothetical protein NGR28_004605 [Vibrio parahaemolyticus]|nr:hypothetical protein [Vibrio parahaemolyticus]